MRWKWIVGVAASLIIVVIVAVYLILSSYDYNKLKPLITRVAKGATGRELTLGGDINLKIGFSPSLVVGDVSFQNASWGSRPELAMIKRLEVQVALLPLIRKKIKVKRFLLIEPDILVETNKAGKSNLEFKPAKGAEPQQPAGKEKKDELKLPALSLRQIQVGKGRFTYRHGRSGKTYVVVGESLQASAKGFDRPLQLEFKGSYKDNPFDLSGILGPFNDLTNPSKPWPLKLSLKVLGTTANVDGSIKDVMAIRGLDLTLSAEVRSIPEIAKLAELADVPDISPLKVGLKISDHSLKTYKFSDLKVAFKDSDLGGSGEISLAHKRPALKAKLSSRNLDLRPILSEDSPEAARNGPSRRSKARTDKVFPDDPLPLDGLKKADARVNFAAGRVLLPTLALNDVSVHLVLKSGHLTASPFKATVGGGKMDGRFELSPNGESAVMSTTAKIEQFEVGRMLQELGLTDIIDGEIDSVEIDLTGSGRSVAGLMASLDGKAIIIMGQGKLKNSYIGLAGGSLGPSLFRLLNPLEEKGKYTLTNCLVCRSDIRDGLADVTALVLDTSSMSVIGEGDVNLKTERLNISLKPVPKEGVGNFSLGLGELSRPFILGGTLAQPALAIDMTQSAITLSRAVGAGALFGPAGVAAALLGQTKGEENPCLAAIEASGKGGKITEGKGSEETGTAGDTVEDSSKGIGGAFKKIFGK